MAIRLPWIRVAGHDLFVPQQRSVDQQRNYGGGRGYGGLTSGGIVNQGTGMGTTLDKSQGNFFTPTRIYSRTPLEIICNESWVARNAIDMPIDDMLRRWRIFDDVDDSALDALQEAEEILDVEHAFMQAIKAGDQYGTGVIVMVTNENGGQLEEPLDVKRIREGDVQALHYFDRYDLSVTYRERDFNSLNFRQPIFYDVHPSYGGVPIRVHHSRVLRFDGIEASTKSGFYNYDYDFGVSVLVPIITSLMQDESFATAVAHLGQEASIAILHIAGLRETIAGGGDPNEPSPEEIAAQINQRKSNYRLLMLDEEGREQFRRETIPFAGLAEIMDQYPLRVAASRRIPDTKFLGRPPRGLNATGISDEKNFQTLLETVRKRKMHQTMRVWTDVLARHIGLRVTPKFTWPPLFEDTPKEQAETSKLKAEALDIMVKAYMMDEDEGRTAADGDALFGELPGPAPEAPEEPDPIELIEAEAKAKASANGNGQKSMPARK